MATNEIMEPLNVVQEFAQAMCPEGYEGSDAACLKSLKVTAASMKPHPNVTTRHFITSSLCNQMGNLHGGAYAIILDTVTSFPLALVRAQGFWTMVGVSRTLNIAYLDSVREGDTVEVFSELVKVGKRMAHLRAVMRKIDERGVPGNIVATCEHGKVHVPGVDYVYVPPKERYSAKAKF